MLRLGGQHDLERTLYYTDWQPLRVQDCESHSAPRRCRSGFVIISRHTKRQNIRHLSSGSSAGSFWNTEIVLQVTLFTRLEEQHQEHLALGPKGLDNKCRGEEHWTVSGFACQKHFKQEAGPWWRHCRHSKLRVATSKGKLAGSPQKKTEEKSKLENEQKEVAERETRKQGLKNTRKEG